MVISNVHTEWSFFNFNRMKLKLHNDAIAKFQSNLLKFLTNGNSMSHLKGLFN